ncbi:MAG TPA: 30S ribosomal protein S17 [Pyrinomonadaceae bacterium]|nr:30S ribosomal protein S17 [Pyrinomonadaceae bacterium]
MAEEIREDLKPTTDDAQVAEGTKAGETLAHEVAPGVDSQAGNASGAEAGKRGNRAQKVGIVASDKMQKTVVVRVDRLVKHPKYRRYVRRTSKFMAHDETGATIGDKVRIVETRPLSARKRWRVVEIVQKAEK